VTDWLLPAGWMCMEVGTLGRPHKPGSVEMRGDLWEQSRNLIARNVPYSSNILTGRLRNFKLNAIKSLSDSCCDHGEVRLRLFDLHRKRSMGNASAFVQVAAAWQFV
jgi:hypothetical protein